MSFATVPAEQATAKTVWVIENSDSIRLPLVKNLELRGFKATGVSSRDEVRQLVSESSEEVDVTVLDINLEDRASPATTGFDAGQDVAENQPALPPRRIVYSGHQDLEHYQAAAESGVDAYIRKATVNGDTILFNQIRSSILVRALSPARSEVSEKLERIAEQNLSPREAARRVCQEVIAPEVHASLDVPFIFLLSHGPHTEILGHTDAEGVERLIDGAHVQDEIFAEKSVSEPFLLEISGREMNQAFEQLQGASFLELFKEGDLRISIGILSAPKNDRLREEKDPRQFASTLIHRLREPIGKQFIYLSKAKGIMERTKLKHTSSFCLYVGETQINVLEESLEKKEIEASNECFRKLKRLADDLCATGIEFSRLNEAPRSETSVEAIEPVSARAVITEAWDMIKSFGVPLELRQSGPDLDLKISHRDLLVAAFRMLQWMAQRQDKIPPGTPRVIEVVYEIQLGGAAISFKDQSRQLRSQLRRRLFEPFTQGTTTSTDSENQGDTQPGLYLPLYLAKVLLTVKNHALLEDRTEESSSEYGHSFMFTFPTEEDSENSAASAG